MIEEYVVRGEDGVREDLACGALVWMDREGMTPSDTLTVGRVTIRAGKSNQEHVHPNCDEDLYLLSGVITHTLGDEKIVLNPGDLIHIPKGEPHQAVNESDVDAVALVVYNTGNRETEWR